MHRADRDADIVLLFRRGECRYPVLPTSLHGLQAGKRHAIEFRDEIRKSTRRTISGNDLMTSLELRLPQRGTSLLVKDQAK